MRVETFEYMYSFDKITKNGYTYRYISVAVDTSRAYVTSPSTYEHGRDEAVANRAVLRRKDKR